MTRSLLNGKLANTTFAILDPTGTKPLSRTARSPQMAFGASEWKSNTDADMDMVYQQLRKHSILYPRKANTSAASVPEFHSFTQALNITSADQRLLLFTVSALAESRAHKEKLKAVANHPDVIGRFHYDFAEKGDAQWATKITATSARTGYFIIRANEFGLTGSQLKHLPLNASAQTLRSALLSANEQFLTSEARKNYSQHKRKGEALGIKFNSPIAAGVDKNRDGEIDEKRKRKKSSNGAF